MREVWRFGVGLELRIAASVEAGPRKEEGMSAGEASMWLRRAAEDGHRGRTLILEVAAAIGGFALHPRARVEEAIAVAERALADGRLRAVVRREWYEGGGKGPESVEPPRRAEPAREERSFVGIQLLTDEPEPKPVPFKRYRIVLPDHSVREGQLDQHGRAMITDIDPGNCQVSFPDYDAADWKAA